MSADDVDSIANFSHRELYEVLSQMQPLFEQAPQQAKQLLTNNSTLAKSLLQAQIMLGTTQSAWEILDKKMSKSKSKSKSTQVVQQQSNVESTQSLPIHPGNEAQTISSVQSIPVSRPLNPSQQSISLQPASIPMSNFSSQSAPLPPAHSQIPSISAPHSSQIHNFPPLPPPPAPHFSTPQAQPSLQMSRMFNQPFQPPLPQQPRPPSMQPFPHHLHSHMPHGLGFQQTGLPQHLLSQPMFHSGNNPASSFQQGQPPLPSQPPPQHLYQGGPHIGAEYNNQAGSSMQTERRPQWAARYPERFNGGPHLPGPPQVFPGQMPMGTGGGQHRPPPLTPEMEKALLQQVMTLTPEQINMLPAEQRQQVIQLQEMLRS